MDHRDPISSGAGAGELRIEHYLDAEGHIVIPDDTTLITRINHNVLDLGDAVAYRYLDYGQGLDATPIELTWRQLGARMRAVAARLQQVSAPGDRVAILAPHGVDYVAGFFAAIAAGAIAVPLSAPEFPGQAERLQAVLTDAEPSVVLTTSEAAEAVRAVGHSLPRRLRPRVIAVDAVPDTVGRTFSPVPASANDVAYLQYTSGSTRTPAGVEITHRGVCTNIVQMSIAVGLDPTIRTVSWLPLFHDMGLLMIMFPALCGGQATLMSPTAFVRRPYRWIRELAEQARYGRTFAAAPNFAFDLAAQRGLPAAGDDLDLSNVAGLINGSEPVSPASIETFAKAFAPYGLPATVVKPSYGLAEATLFVSTIAPTAQPGVIHLDRDQLGAGRALLVAPDSATAVAQVSCGQVARSLWAVVVDAGSEAELPDGRVGEIWLHGDNIGRGYWGRKTETRLTFGNKLQSRLEVGSHAEGSAVGGAWLRTGDLGMYLDGELYIVGRSKDLVIIDGRNHYPQDIEATVGEASTAVRTGYVTAFSVPQDGAGEQLVIIAERAPGAGRDDPSPIVDAVRAAVSRRHGLAAADVRLVAAGRIPRTTSGKVARRECRSRYLAGEF
ncbi:MAG TPA: fatty acyl-AMP ligase [Mycobacterium sp.]|nr:fatty acyl-AMP ligase [Mycobacterium sp.]